MLSKELKFSQNRAGFSLLEVMMALGVLGTIVGIVSFTISTTQTQVTASKAIAERNDYAHQVERILSDPKSLLYSAQSDPLADAGNIDLLHCLMPSPQPCAATSSATPVAFNLYEKRGGPVRRSGTAANPVKVDVNGAPNCVGTVVCPLWNVATYFWATCPGNTATCAHATSVQVAFQMLPARATYLDKTLTPYPTSLNFVSLRVAQVQDQKCPPNSYQAGFLVGGTIECKCVNGDTNPPIGLDGLPICIIAAKICAPNQILHGRHSDGTPICVNTRRVCPGLINFGDKDATCPNGGWLEGLNLGTCNTQGSGGKKGGGSNVVQCSNNQGYCCYYEMVP